jgi:aspartate kinase
MCGVTNSLIEAATQCELGNSQGVAAIFEELRTKHRAALGSLILSASVRARTDGRFQTVFEEGERLCQRAILSRELTSVTRDSITALGERLCAPLLAAALTQSGMAGEAIEATELIVTDARHGNADPIMSATRRRCEVRLLPLLQRGIIPVVTGFVGATTEGVLTTLGRGGSDYSATILGAAVDAHEIVIWTDVDGILTADPRLVSQARTIRELSYQEATELAYFGAKVLHPKTLRPVRQSGIPIRIQNSFAPERAGTTITPTSSGAGREVMALSAVPEATVITLTGSDLPSVNDVLGRALAATSSVQVDVLLTVRTSERGIDLGVLSSNAQRAMDALRSEFAQELESAAMEPIRVDSTVAIVTAVGRSKRATDGVVARLSATLMREHINVIAVEKGLSEYSISFVVDQKDLNAAVLTAHRELRLELPDYSTSSSQECFAEGAA